MSLLMSSIMSSIKSVLFFSFGDLCFPMSFFLAFGDVRCYFLKWLHLYLFLCIPFFYEMTGKSSWQFPGCRARGSWSWTTGVWILAVPPAHARVLSCSVVSYSVTLLDCSPPGSSVYGIFQARILEWVAVSSSRASSWSRDQACVSCVSCLAGKFITHKPATSSETLIQFLHLFSGDSHAHLTALLGRLCSYM